MRHMPFVFREQNSLQRRRSNPISFIEEILRDPKTGAVRIVSSAANILFPLLEACRDAGGGRLRRDQGDRAKFNAGQCEKRPIHRQLTKQEIEALERHDSIAFLRVSLPKILSKLTSRLRRN
jgi:hypothetical protein